MDKSFNDQELSDIMKEIEALEEDFSATDDKVSAVMEDLDLKEAAPTKTSEVVAMDAYRAPPAKTQQKAATSMSFKVQGDLAMDLEFNIGGTIVSVGVTESGLTIEMDGGAKFTVPVAAKKAA